MIIEEFTKFTDYIDQTGSLISLDLGTKTIGIALSDQNWHIATPYETIKRKKFNHDVERLLHIITKENVIGIILGLPLNMNGTQGPRCQATHAFARNFSQHSILPITFWDERLSSVAAQRAMLEADLSRSKRAALIDHVAAAYILQGALDRIRNIHHER